MLRRLRLIDFKSFEDTAFALRPFTLLIGSNASGKSNVRDALRVLHGVARGYSLAEVLGEKWGDGGELLWTGIRGGARQVARHGRDHFEIHVDLTVHVPGADGASHPTDVAYGIRVALRDGATPVLAGEWLRAGSLGYDTRGVAGSAGAVVARVGADVEETFATDRPLLGQIAPGRARDVAAVVDAVVADLASMRFLDLDPDLARRAAPRGVTTLGDRGQNLSAVLRNIAARTGAREPLVGWIRALTPMDATDVDFEDDLDGRTLAVLVEGDGERTPLSTASDGTVRFLAIVALLLTPHPPSIVFIEEIENGIHPHRVALLLDLLDQCVAGGRTQVVATSHSPQLLESTWEAADASPFLVTRTPHGSIVVDVADREEFRSVIEQDDPAELMSDGWFEDVATLVFAGEEPGA